MKRIMIFSTVFGIIFGIIFITVGLILFFSFDPDSYDGETVGYITRFEEYTYEDADNVTSVSYKTFIDYEVNGKTYRDVEYGSYNSSMKIGDDVKVYYMSSDPSQITGPGKEFVPYLGLIAAVIGLVSIVFTVIRRLRMNTPKIIS